MAQVDTQIAFLLVSCGHKYRMQCLLFSDWYLVDLELDLQVLEDIDLDLVLIAVGVHVLDYV
jgi:hypothetical protein